eukprot:jgi/Tetstr1/436656/TSEL_025451.t1
MWGELVNITKDIDFRNLLQTHTTVKNLVTQETTRIVDISRVNVEFIAWAWGKTRFSPRINYAEQQLVDYTMNTQRKPWSWMEAAAERVATTIDMEVEELIVEAGARRGALTPVMEMMVGEPATSLRQVTNGNGPKTPQLNGYAQVVGGEEGKVPRMPLMEIAKRLVIKHEPVEDGWEMHVVMRALESNESPSA